MSSQELNAIRVLAFCREPYPTSRVDVDVLLGEQLSGRLGHRIDVVMQAGNDEIKAGSYPWHGSHAYIGPRLREGGPLRRLALYALSVVHDFRQLLRVDRRTYDAIQVRDKFGVGALAVLVARLRRMPFIYWLSFPLPESQIERFRSRTARFPVLTLVRGLLGRALLYRIILPNCSHAFVQSHRMKEDLVAHGACREKLTAVPMGVRRADVLPMPRQTPSPDIQSAKFTLGYLGTMTPERRLEILVDTLHRVRQTGIDAWLIFVGGSADGMAEDRIHRAAEKYGIREFVEITGFLPRPTALTRIAEADVCFSPFFPTPILLSTSPTKLVEYLALGLPVIANDHPEQRLVLNQSNAGMCVPWGAKYFARATICMYRIGAVRRMAMGEGGRRWVLMNRTYESIAESVALQYRRIVDDHQVGVP